MNEFAPDYRVHPGDYLHEIISERNITFEHVQRITGLTAYDLIRIFAKKIQVKNKLAKKLEKLTGVSAEIWNGMNKRYYEKEIKQ